ncbi:nitroreductase family protein [Eubacterium pyruvativorans]|uniref:nitroreductase family protein n=1 Tax=Eubacterium pyruvativorans TaxID=155865 RepID=UPI0013D5EF15|nr:nitroreductase family protein [Eubacterium pyruvativorans]
METKNCIETRRSIRKFTDQKIPAEVLRELIRLASFSPSWKNTQTVRYYAVTNRKVMDKLANECVMNFPGNKKIIDGAPMVIAVATKHGRSGFERDGSFSTSKGEHWESFDAGIATQTLCLAANELGLGTVIMGIFDADLVAEAIDLPEGQRISALVGIGYPDIAPEMPPRKSVDDLLTVIE